MMAKRDQITVHRNGGGVFKYDLAFMRKVALDYESGLSLSQAAAKYQISKDQVAYWRKRFGSDIVEQIPKPIMTEAEKQEHALLKKQLAEQAQQLEYLKMKALALETMIDIAKEEFNIDLRKKAGTKPSEK
jgi:transposase-like protein